MHSLPTKNCAWVNQVDQYFFVTLAKFWHFTSTTCVCAYVHSVATGAGVNDVSWTPRARCEQSEDILPYDTVEFAFESLRGRYAGPHPRKAGLVVAILLDGVLRVCPL